MNVTENDSTRLEPGQEDTGPLQQQNMGSSCSSSFPSTVSAITTTYARFKQCVCLILYYFLFSLFFFFNSFYYFFSFTVLFIKTRCFDPVNLQSAWDAPDALPSHWSKSARVSMLATSWCRAGCAVLHGEHFLPGMPTASQTRLTWTSLTLPKCLPKSWDKSHSRGSLQRASPGCPACNVSLVSPSCVLALARRNSTGAGETSGEDVPCDSWLYWPIQ